MSIPRVFAPVKPQDFTMRAVTVNKKFLLQKSDLYSGSQANTGSGYKIWNAIFTNDKLRLGTERTYPTNSFDGTYQHIVWKSIDTQFYRYPYDSAYTLEHSNKRFSKKFLNYSASIFSMPYLDFGEGIKPGSFELTTSQFTLTDDRNGNLYDVSLNTSSYSNRSDIVGYWGFNELFKKGKEIPHTFEYSTYEYDSYNFQPDEPSTIYNLRVEPGVPLNNTSSGISAYFDNSYVLTHNRPEFNFSKQDDFTISFWVKYLTGSTYPVSTLISKNGIIREQVYGTLDKINQNDIVIPTLHTSTSIEYKPTDVYPYRFDIVSGSNIIRFSRSDGRNSIILSGSSNLNDSRWHHIATVKTGSNIILYQDSVPVMSSSRDVTYQPLNKHSLMFGSDSFTGVNYFKGYLDEIRIYNKGLAANTIQSLSNSSSLAMYQSSVVGNVFYKSGQVVFTSFDQKYNQFNDNNWTIRYRGTHTIYEWECLVRIKKGDFNLSLNPTYLKAPNTDLIRDDATGSLSEGGLYPYFHTIGLYNDAAELVAIGKVNQPIQVRDDVDLNVSIKWHT